MDDMPQFPWFNIHDHDHGDHQEQQNFDFDSDDIFLNPIHQLSPTNWANQAIAYADLVCNNGFLDIKNSIPTTTTSTASLEFLLSCTNSSINDSSDGMPVVFSDDKTLWRNDDIVTRNNNVSGVSSGDSVTDDGVLSQSLQQINQIECSSGSKRPIERVGVSENQPRPKRSRSDPGQPTSSTINFQQPGNSSETDTEAIAQMKEMIYREAAFRPVSFAAETVVDKPKRKNVRISSDPQTVAARERRERISERIRVLQKLVPGGNKMDTASMLDEAANYLKFLRSQVKALEQVGQNSTPIIPHSSMVAPFTQNIFSMQPHFQYPHENLYPNPPPA